MIHREIEKTIQNHCLNHRLLILEGPKFIGRTDTVLAAITKNESRIFNTEIQKEKNRFSKVSRESLLRLFGKKKYIIIREAQLIKNLQALIECFLFEEIDVNLICICSYEPVLDEILYEALEAQKLILKLIPLSFPELARYMGLVRFEQLFSDRLIYGNYGEVVQHPEKAITFLNKVLDSIVGIQLNQQDRINKSDKLKKMLQVLALSIGEDVSYNEVALQAGMDNETVERYVYLLEKAFVLIRIPSYSTGKKYELKKSQCIYFMDNGIRNALINNFNEFGIRNDAKALWKNWLISEKVKKSFQGGQTPSFYFWKTHTRQRIDLLEFKKEGLFIYQIKWDKNERSKIPGSFLDYYPGTTSFHISRANYWNFLAKE